METYNNIEIIKILQKNNLSLFTLTDFAKLFKIENRETLYKKIQRLEEKEIIKKLIKGKYLFLFNKPDDFTVANFLYQPSYISLESALSFHSLITGFPYQITSITTKKAKLYAFDQKSFQYAQIKPDYFWGFEKKENFLIAEKEKALLDYVYLVFKGWRILTKKDLRSDFDLSQINKEKFITYLKLFKNKQFINFIKGVGL